MSLAILMSSQAAVQLQQTRKYAAKEIQFGTEGRASMLAGVERLANAVQVTLGPKVSLDHVMRALIHVLVTYSLGPRVSPCAPSQAIRTASEGSRSAPLILQKSGCALIRIAVNVAYRRDTLK